MSFCLLVRKADSKNVCVCDFLRGFALCCLRALHDRRFEDFRVWVLCLGRMSQTYQALMAPFTQFRAWSTWRVIGAPGKCGGQFESC